MLQVETVLKNKAPSVTKLSFKNDIFRLSESSKMEGNDFIIFKHGCGEDSTFFQNQTRYDCTTKNCLYT